jgi:hypothetical protein
MKTHLSLAVACAALASAPILLAHDTGSKPHDHGPTAVPVTFQVEKKGPVKAPAAQAKSAVSHVSGQGFWKFAPVANAMPVPAEAQSFVKGAHGTLIVDSERDVVYWGLEKVGWVGFSDRLKTSWVVKGDPSIASGNLHGADLFPRKGQLPLVVAADNVEGEILLSDTTFRTVEKLKIPDGGPYADK